MVRVIVGMGGSVHDNAFALHMCGKVLVNRCLYSVDSHIREVRNRGGDRRDSIDMHMRVVGPEGFVKHGEVRVDKNCSVEEAVSESFTDSGARDFKGAAVVLEEDRSTGVGIDLEAE